MRWRVLEIDQPDSSRSSPKIKQVSSTVAIGWCARKILQNSTRPFIFAAGISLRRFRLSRSPRDRKSLDGSFRDLLSKSFPGILEWNEKSTGYRQEDGKGFLQNEIKTALRFWTTKSMLSNMKLNIYSVMCGAIYLIHNLQSTAFGIDQMGSRVRPDINSRCQQKL